MKLKDRVKALEDWAAAIDKVDKELAKFADKRYASTDNRLIAMKSVIGSLQCAEDKSRHEWAFSSFQHDGSRNFGDTLACYLFLCRDCGAEKRVYRVKYLSAEQIRALKALGYDPKTDLAQE